MYRPLCLTVCLVLVTLGTTPAAAKPDEVETAPPAPAGEEPLDEGLPAGEPPDAPAPPSGVATPETAPTEPSTAPKPAAVRPAPSKQPSVAVLDDPPPVTPLARTNRLCLSLGFGFGSAFLGRVHELSGDLTARIAQQGVTLDSPPESPLRINAETALRYYLPFYILAQAGYSALYNWAKVPYEASAGPVRVSASLLRILTWRS